jgi:dTDP-4-dehydrorhamnose reductase
VQSGETIMKIILAGASGQLGCELVRQAQRFDICLQTPTHDQMDITRYEAVKTTLLKLRPDMVINAAAYTDVDRAETEAAKAFAVNAIGPENLARCCARIRIPLLHVSTDFVFDGNQQHPYRETDPVAPLGVYGQSKALGEEKIRTLLAEHILVRAAWLYGIDGRNFVKTILKLAREKTHLRVVNDQYGSPTSAADLADVLLKMATLLIKKSANDLWGTYHYCGQGITNWHEFAGTILTLAKPHLPLQAKHIAGITTADWPTSAKRPQYSALDCSRIKEHFGLHPRPWQHSLKETLERILAEPHGRESKLEKH